MDEWRINGVVRQNETDRSLCLIRLQVRAEICVQFFLQMTSGDSFSVSQNFHFLRWPGPGSPTYVSVTIYSAGFVRMETLRFIKGTYLRVRSLYRPISCPFSLPRITNSNHLSFWGSKFYPCLCSIGVDLVKLELSLLCSTEESTKLELRWHLQTLANIFCWSFATRFLHQSCIAIGQQKVRNEKW